MNELFAIIGALAGVLGGVVAVFQIVEYVKKPRPAKPAVGAPPPAAPALEAGTRSATNNLPLQLTRFIGRAAERKLIGSLLSQDRLVSLIGPGGCGKTRLALQVAEDSLAAFRDGVWFVRLDSVTDPSLVPEAVAAALGIKQESGRPTLETLVSEIRDKHVLLVFDNCEQVVEACAALAEGLLYRCARLIVLTTTREELRVTGERIVEVASLSTPGEDLPTPTAAEASRYESIQLFVDRATLSFPDFRLSDENAPAVARTCSRLEGLPLAIELAAARCRDLALEKISSALDDLLTLLSRGTRTLHRHETMRAAIQWSFGLTSETEKAVLRRLAVFMGGWSVEAAREVCAFDRVSAEAVEETLMDLRAKNLIKRASPDGRFRMLAVIREFCEEKLEEAGEEGAAGDRHLAFFLERSRATSASLLYSNGDAPANELAEEHDNIRSALRWSLANAPLRCAELGVSLAWFWVSRAHLEEGARWLRDAHFKMEKVDEQGWNFCRLQGQGFSRLGLLHYLQAHYSTMTLCCERGLVIAEHHGDPWEISFCLNLLGLAALYANDVERGLAYLLESEAAARESHDKWLLAFALLNQGLPRFSRGELVETEALSRESLVLLTELGNNWFGAYPFIHLGHVARRQNRFGEAITLYRQGLTRSSEIRNRRSLAGALEGMAGMALVQGRAESSVKIFSAAAELRRVINAPVPLVWRPDVERDLADAKVALGPEVFATHWKAGQRWSAPEASREAFALADSAGTGAGGR